MVLIILKFIGVLLAVIIVAKLFNIVEKTIQQKKAISFKESLETAALPIVSFYNNHKKLNFLIDTGSNLSYINSSIISNLKYQKNENSVDSMGVEGNVVTVNTCLMTISHKGKRFSEIFGIMDLSQPFQSIKDEDGIELHGILGNSFLETYKYKIDFGTLTIHR